MSSVRTDDNTTFINELSRLVGHSHLLTDPAKTARYRKGFRSGQGDALAVVFPGTLLELWRVLSACVAADKIILMQAANTGLTEGSTPNGNDYDRDIVVISTLRLDTCWTRANRCSPSPAPRFTRWKKRLSRWDANRTR